MITCERFIATCPPAHSPNLACPVSQTDLESAKKLGSVQQRCNLAVGWEGVVVLRALPRSRVKRLRISLTRPCYYSEAGTWPNRQENLEIREGACTFSGAALTGCKSGNYFSEARGAEPAFRARVGCWPAAAVGTLPAAWLWMEMQLETFFCAAGLLRLVGNGEPIG